jgi:hypothetical protein
VSKKRYWFHGCELIVVQATNGSWHITIDGGYNSFAEAYEAKIEWSKRA